MKYNLIPESISNECTYKKKTKIKMLQSLYNKDKHTKEKIVLRLLLM